MVKIRNYFKRILIDKRRLLRIAFFLFFDLFFIALSISLAFVLRFEAKIPHQHIQNIFGMIILALLILPPVFNYFKLYSFSWTYVSASELISLIQASTLGFAILASAMFVLKDQPYLSGFPRSILFISYFLVILFTGAVRFAKRIYIQFFHNVGQGEKERTLIVGAGDVGEQIIRSISAFKFSPYLPVGFIDDSSNKKGISIHGLRVLGKIDDIPSVAKKENVEGLIIAISSASSSTIKRAVEMGRKAGIKKIKVVPSMHELIDGKIGIANLREVQVNDLLGREPISLDQSLIDHFIKEKKVLITGGAGSIGSELCRQVAKFNPLSLLILDQDETGIFNIVEELKESYAKLNIASLVADIQDKAKIREIFKEFSPQVVFHAAAYKHVPLMEENPDEAVKNNIFGTKTVAELARENRVEKFIFISTDKAVNPKSVMGATKRVGEMICQILNQKGPTKFISVRFGNVLDSRGSVIPVFKEQIKRGGPVKITHPGMRRYFMTTPEACLLVMQASAMGLGGEVFILDMGRPVKIIDLAKELIKLSGLEPDKDIAIVFTKPRPGEKLFEEMLTAEEGTIATQNEKIFIARLSEVKEGKLSAGLERLKTAAYNLDKETIIETLKKVVPNYE